MFSNVTPAATSSHSIKIAADGTVRVEGVVSFLRYAGAVLSEHLEPDTWHISSGISPRPLRRCPTFDLMRLEELLASPVLTEGDR